MSYQVSWEELTQRKQKKDKNRIVLDREFIGYAIDRFKYMIKKINQSNTLAHLNEKRLLSEKLHRAKSLINGLEKIRKMKTYQSDLIRGKKNDL